MLSQYFPLLLQVIIVLGFAGTAIILSMVLGKRANRNAMKDSAYECGSLPIGSGAPKFNVHYYLIAMLFVIFDLEVVFLYPWSVMYKELIGEHSIALWSMLGFLGLLTCAYIYAFKKGGLNPNAGAE